MYEADKKIVDKYLEEIPVKLVSLAKELGLEVFKASLKPTISGLIEPSETASSGFRIKINRHEVVSRQRFTLAHEMAHYLLHRDQIGTGVIDSVMYRSKLSSRREVEANKLAADIVMPREKIKNILNELSNLPQDEVVDLMSEQFSVSNQAMRIRLGY